MTAGATPEPDIHYYAELEPGHSEQRCITSLGVFTTTAVGTENNSYFRCRTGGRISPELFRLCLYLISAATPIHGRNGQPFMECSDTSSRRAHCVPGSRNHSPIPPLTDSWSHTSFTVAPLTPHRYRILLERKRLCSAPKQCRSLFPSPESERLENSWRDG